MQQHGCTKHQHVGIIKESVDAPNSHFEEFRHFSFPAPNTKKKKAHGFLFPWLLSAMENGAPPLQGFH